MQKKTSVVEAWKPDLYSHYTEGKHILDAEITEQNQYIPIKENWFDYQNKHLRSQNSIT